MGKVVERKKGGHKSNRLQFSGCFLTRKRIESQENEEIPAEKLEFAIISFEQRGRNTNLVVSRRRLFQKILNDFFNNKKAGDVVEGIVESIDDRGASVKIAGSINGYVPNSEISYNSSMTARNMLSVGKVMKFMIKDIDPVKKRVILSVKHSCRILKY